MYRKIVLLALVSMLLLSFVTQFTVQVKAQPKTIYVDDDNTAGPWDGTPEYPYQNITSALEHASDNDTIYVYNGTYYERVNVNKTLSLIGENPATTIIDGSGTGTVVSVKALDVTIKGFTIQNAGQGIAGCGIYVTNHTEEISNNIIRNNARGIWLLESNGSSIIGNTIMNSSWAGIYISDSNENIFYDNVVAYNSVGAIIASSTIPNTFYHNNFIDNSNQAFSFNFTNWNGTEGNYWSDYTGVDTDGDGIGDDPHSIDLGTDYHPLIIPTRPFPVVVDDVVYLVAVLSNSTISSFRFIQANKTILFDVTGPPDRVGFCNITIPKDLMNFLLDDWEVKVNGAIPTYFPTPIDNGTHTFVYFEFITTGTLPVEVTILSEFPIALIMPLLIIFTLVAVLLRKSMKETSES